MLTSLQSYAAVLCALTVILPAAGARIITLHATAVLFAVFASLVYRNVWPLLTFTLCPADDADGMLLWVEVALVALSGVLIPLFEPYPYVPLDPKVLSPHCARSLH